MAVRSKELASGQTPTAFGVVSVYTVPAGKTALVKNVGLWSFTARRVHISTRRSSVSANTRPIVTLSLTADTAQQVDLWIALEPGDELLVVNLLAGDYVTYWASGAELAGVA